MKRTWLKMMALVAVLVVLAALVAPATAETVLRPGYSGQVMHVVRWGDTVTSIADQYGTSPILIINANKLRNPDHLAVGQRLVVPLHNYVSPGYTAPAPVPQPAPGGCIPYTIQPGDSTSSIAARFGVSELSLIQVNNLINPNYIHAGVTIRVCNVAYTPPAQVVLVPVPQVIVQPVIVNPPPPPPPPAPSCNTRYTVQRNDTLHGIATRYRTDVQAIRRSNNLTSDYIWVGQVLYVPCPYQAPPPPPPPAHKPPPAPPAQKPPAPQLSPAVCNPAVAISYPRQNEHVSGVINIVGTASLPNFQFYKVEYGQGEVPFNFASIGEVTTVRRTGTTLTTWDTGTVPNGVYILRLTAVENSGQFPQPCNVRIVVDN